MSKPATILDFMVLDAFAKASNTVLRTGDMALSQRCGLEYKSLILLKPSTFMNLSGNAIRYWLQKEKIENQICWWWSTTLRCPLEHCV
jgi:PTH1 family peptidyl-tRNA hydrolase